MPRVAVALSVPRCHSTIAYAIKSARPKVFGRRVHSAGSIRPAQATLRPLTTGHARLLNLAVAGMVLAHNPCAVDSLMQRPAQDVRFEMQSKLAALGPQRRVRTLLQR